MEGFAVQEALDKVASDLLARFGGGDHVGPQPPRLGYFGLVSAELLGNNLFPVAGRMRPGCGHHGHHAEAVLEKKCRGTGNENEKHGGP